MEEDIFLDWSITNATKNYSNHTRNIVKPEAPEYNSKRLKKGEPLTTKNAVKYLLEGKLKSVVCRYCLNVAPSLSELDQILQVAGAGAGATYKVTIRDMVASFHPVQVADDPNLPDKICYKCVNLAISGYLFTQQCERSERALRNCLDDMYNKLEKLDPLERPKKRGRQKLKPNHNVLHAEHERVIDYAEPIINIVNQGAESMSKEPEMTDLECKRCWQVLPNQESLLNHEKTHPSTMWYHCRLCGKSFPKCNQFKKHYHRVHVLGKEPSVSVNNNFKCNECGQASDSYKQHLQHMEKHKFKVVMDHVIGKKMDHLCMVCLDKSPSLVEMDKMVCIHGGYPELTGDRTLQSLLASTLPDMNFKHEYIGTKICEKCLNNAITSYIFINQFGFARERLDVCVSHMLKSIADIDPLTNVFIHIPDNTIMPIQDDIDETLLLDDNDYIDESKIKVDVLEDEFRLKSDSENEEINDSKLFIEIPVKKRVIKLDEIIEMIEPIKEEIYMKDIEEEINIKGTEEEIDIQDLEDDYVNPAKNVTKTYAKKRLVNGLQNKYTDVCSEFLTFNKKKPKRKCRYTCPLCSKHFISHYFLKRHISKHVNMKKECTLCERVFQSKFYLYEHTKMVHLLKQTDYVSCKACGRSFLSEDKLQLHMKRHSMITCELCNKVYMNQRHFNNHMQRHSVKLKLLRLKNIQTCSFCEKECTNDNHLSLHVNKVHFSIKPYACDMCDRQFYVHNNLKYHKKVHNMPSKEICVFCNKTLKSRRQLVVHVRRHIGVKPFACQICGQSFYSQNKAGEHMKVYHGGRFCCSVCKTTFTTKYGLKEHVDRVHSFI